MATINYYGNIYHNTSTSAITYTAMKEMFEQGQTRELEAMKKRIADLERQLLEKDDLIKSLLEANTATIPQNETILPIPAPKVEMSNSIFFGSGDESSVEAIIKKPKRITKKKVVKPEPEPEPAPEEIAMPEVELDNLMNLLI